MKKIVSSVMLALILISTLTIAFSIQPIKVTEGTIYIRADGSIDPSAAPIQRDGNLYTFTADIYDSIVVERDNIVIDGAGYTLQGTESGIGVSLPNISNVTIKNIRVQAFQYGIDLFSCSNITVTNNTMINNEWGILARWGSLNNKIIGNNITNSYVGINLSLSANNTIATNELYNNTEGVRLYYYSGENIVINNTVIGNGVPLSKGIFLYQDAENCIVSRNVITNTWAGVDLIYRSNNNLIFYNNVTHSQYGILLHDSSNNTLSYNSMIGNDWGIYAYDSANNTLTDNNIMTNDQGITLSNSSGYTLVRNNITANGMGGIWLYYSSNNKIVHNNFIDNLFQADSYQSVNVWDDGYPSGGNYWSDYNGTDVYNGPYQNETGSDGIGDTYYTIDENNIDKYPLIAPTYVSVCYFNLTITSTEGGKTDPESGTYTYLNGTKVFVTAIPNINYELAYWELDEENVGSNNPIEVLINSDCMLRAVFRLLTYNLTISATTGGTTDPTPGIYTHVNGTVVSITAIPDISFRFEYWILDGVNAGSDNPIEVLMDSNHFLEAVFTEITYQLLITTTAGGTTNPEPGNYTYVNGTVVSVTALPNAGYSFDYWLLDGEERVENLITLIMNANHTLEAVFVDDIQPEIGTPIQEPPENVEQYQNVTVTVNVTDLGTGVYNVTLWYSLDNGTTWMDINMTEISTNTYQARIPGYKNCTWVMYKIIAHDNNGNQATNDNHGYYYIYHVIPEFLSTIIILLFLILSMPIVIFTKRKIPRKLKA